MSKTTTKDNLHKAIDLAKDLGGCAYADDHGNPLCVIGQLIALEGLALPSRDSEEYQDFWIERVNRLMAQEPAVFKVLERYPISVLVQLQDVWDRISRITRLSEESIKQHMHAIVEEYYSYAPTAL